MKAGVIWAFAAAAAVLPPFTSSEFPSASAQVLPPAEPCTVTDATWSLTSFQTPRIVKDLAFVDESRGWALLDNGEVWRTSDAGDSWNRVFMPALGPSHTFEAIWFAPGPPGEERGWVAGSYSDLTGIHALLLQSDSSGTTWHQAQMPVVGGPLFDVRFDPDGIHGHAVGRKSVLNSADAGASWTSASTLPPSSGFDLYSAVFFTDASTGYMVDREYPSIFRTSDGGKSWTVGRPGNLDDPGGAGGSGYRAIAFPDRSTGFVAGANGRILATTDGGISWLQRESCASGHVLRDLKFAGGANCPLAFPACNAIAVGNGGTIVGTTDGGSSWRPQTSGSNAIITTVAYPSGTTAYAGTSEGTVLKGKIKLIPIPLITGLEPASGPASGGTKVALTGSGFLDVTSVRFGPLEGTFRADPSGTRIEAVSPPNVPGTVDVTVSAAGGVSAPKQFLYFLPSLPLPAFAVPPPGPAPSGDPAVLPPHPPQSPPASGSGSSAASTQSSPPPAQTITFPPQSAPPVPPAPPGSAALSVFPHTSPALSVPAGSAPAPQPAGFPGQSLQPVALTALSAEPDAEQTAAPALRHAFTALQGASAAALVTLVLMSFLAAARAALHQAPAFPALSCGLPSRARATRAY